MIDKDYKKAKDTEIGAILAKRREEMKYPTRLLAKDVGISEAMLYRIFKGDGALYSTIAKLCDALNIEIKITPKE